MITGEHTSAMVVVGKNIVQATQNYMYDHSGTRLYTNKFLWEVLPRRAAVEATIWTPATIQFTVVGPGESGGTAIFPGLPMVDSTDFCDSSASVSWGSLNRLYNNEKSGQIAEMNWSDELPQSWYELNFRNSYRM